MKKRVFAMLMAAVMALSLVACGSKSDNGGSGDASGTETIKLGGVGPLTGGYANYGLSVQHGAELRCIRCQRVMRLSVPMAYVQRRPVPAVPAPERK